MKLLLILFIACCTPILAQNEFEMPIKIRSVNGDSTQIAVFGIKSNATINIDTALGEYDVPPLYQKVLGELFHFIDYTYNEEVLSYKDFRPDFKSDDDSIVYNLEVANINQVFSIEWGSFPKGIVSATMRSKFYSVDYDKIDMIKNNKIEIKNPAITDLIIVLRKSDITSVEDNDSKITLFPNPCTNSIQLNTDCKLISASLVNSIGEYFEIKISGNNTINMDRIPTGTYYLIISDENNSVIRKKIIKY